MQIKVLEKAIRLLFLVGLATSVACGGSSGSSGTPPTPVAYTYAAPTDTGDTWTVGDAADQGIDVIQLESLIEAIRAGSFNYIDSIVISRNGVLVFDETIRTSTDAEDSRVGNTDPSMHAQFSAVKSITALAVGIAIDAGNLPDVDTPYLDLFPYVQYDNWDDRKNDMTLGHVLAMRSGLDWNEWDPPYTSPDNQLIRFYNDEFDYAKGLLDLPLAIDPGTAFTYNTAATISLAQAVENAGPMSFVDFGLNSLLLPLGITEVEFLTTPTGLPNAGGGFYFKTRDMAKFGQLVLDGGSWNSTAIVSQAWLDDMLTPHSDITWANPDDWEWQLDGYGYQWWLGHYDVNGESLGTWTMWGFGGQWVVVVPERQLVVAINSHGYDDSDTALNQAHGVIRNYILATLDN